MGKQEAAGKEWEIEQLRVFDALERVSRRTALSPGANGPQMPQKQ